MRHSRAEREHCPTWLFMSPILSLGLEGKDGRQEYKGTEDKLAEERRGWVVRETPA